MPGWNDNIRASASTEPDSNIRSTLKRKRDDVGIDPRTLRALYLSWIVKDNLSFNLVESSGFRRFLEYVSPRANELLPKSHTTIRQDLAIAVRLRRPELVEDFSKAQSKIHIVYDAWTSNNHFAFFGIQCRFLDVNYVFQNLLLGLPELTNEHSVVQQTEALFSVTELYRCTESLGFTVSDNAATMDLMATKIQEQIINAGVVWDANLYRIRCLGHIIHLAAHDFFFRRTADNDNDTILTTTPDVDDRAAWRDLGCYDKLYNIVVWVQRSLQRRNRLRELCDLQLIRDNTTRWYFYFDMCQRALQCKVALIELVASEAELEAEFLTFSD